MTPSTRHSGLDLFLSMQVELRMFRPTSTLCLLWMRLHLQDHHRTELRRRFVSARLTLSGSLLIVESWTTWFPMACSLFGRRNRGALMATMMIFVMDWLLCKVMPLLSNTKLPSHVNGQQWSLRMMLKHFSVAHFKTLTLIFSFPTACMRQV